MGAYINNKKTTQPQTGLCCLLSFSISNEGLSIPKLQEGSFTVVERGQTIIKLTYYASYKFALFAFIAVLIIAYFSGPILLIPGAFLLITFVIDYYNQKSKAESFLERIIYEDKQASDSNKL